MDFSRLDRIFLTRADAIKIMEWDRENHINYNRDEGISFPITEGLVELEEDYHELFKFKPVTLTYFHISEERMKIVQYDKSDMKELLSFTVGDGEDDISNIKSPIKRATKKDMLTNAQMALYLLFCIFQYMTSTKDVIEKKESKTITKKQKNKKSSSTNKKRVTKISTIKYTFDFSGKNRDYNRHTFAWTVRGHWRQLKNGGRVWIKPYVKGDEDKVEPKFYKF